MTQPKESKGESSFDSSSSSSHENDPPEFNQTYKLQRKLVFDGQIVIVPDKFVESKKPVVSTRSQVDWLPRYSDGTRFPANFLWHETVVGYPSDRWARNDGVDDVLDIVSLFEEENLRCCIFEVVALQYYGSERCRNVCIIMFHDRSAARY